MPNISFKENTDRPIKACIQNVHVSSNTGLGLYSHIDSSIEKSNLKGDGHQKLTIVYRSICELNGAVESDAQKSSLKEIL